jgi:hypothetical protein
VVTAIRSLQHDKAAPVQGVGRSLAQPRSPSSMATNLASNDQDGQEEALPEAERLYDERVAARVQCSRTTPAS